MGGMGGLGMAAVVLERPGEAEAGAGAVLRRSLPPCMPLPLSGMFTGASS